jgi:V-type H+-transporting ATPase subunit C
MKAFHVPLQLFDAGILCRKVANYLGDVLEDQRDKLAENLLAAGVDLATYITQFR